MTKIYELLHRDHEKVKRALNRILDTSERAKKTRETLFSEIKADLELHTKFEEEVFYPEFRKAKRDAEARQEIKDALEEHDEAKGMLAEIAGMDKTSEAFVEKIGALKEALEHHISDEEDEMFPQAKSAMDDAAAEAMGKRYQDMKSG